MLELACKTTCLWLLLVWEILNYWFNSFNRPWFNHNVYFFLYMGFRRCFFQRIDLFHLKYQMCAQRASYLFVYYSSAQGVCLYLWCWWLVLPTLFFSVTRSLLALLMFLKNQSFKSHIDFLCFLFHWFLLKLYYLLSSAYFEFNLLFIFWFLKMET